MQGFLPRITTGNIFEAAPNLWVVLDCFFGDMETGMRWLAKNFKYRLSRALSHPRYTAKALVNDVLGIDERFLAKLTRSSISSIRKFLNEPSNDSELMRYWKNCEPKLRDGPHPGNDLYAKKVLMQYVLARAMAPETIVETGVANGISSTYLLRACHLNGKGHVYSIDINNKEFLAAGNQIGWIVPEHLRARWTLLLGDSRIVLPHILSQLGMVDIFIHDSSHTYEDMKFEFETSYPHIRSGGLLLSDDADFNAAFSECAKKFQPESSRIIRNLGIMKKAKQ
ncbi:MAG TPA: class I SAM-dependent methyltransferase [Candidatus Saccharimonadales bacterium]|nr:class I SAM-dependent methyltransferase [Candidatus Saccharimonadales bacterium]